MQDTHTTFWLGDDIDELQQVTAAFLADRYDNGAGAYVATPGDIADLQKATAAFLADRSDGECFCLDNAGQGLLLPGEQFLLPAAAAVKLTRAGPSTAIDVVDLVDDLLHDQMDYEDSLGSPTSEACFGSTQFTEVEYTSFDEVLGPNFLPDTPPFGGYTVAPHVSGLPYIALEVILNLPNEVDRILGIYDDDEAGDNNSDSDGEEEDAFELPTVLSPSQASYAASFFDSQTQSIVPYASLDGILALESQHGELVSESTTRVVKPDLLEINTHLPMIPEEPEPFSAASDCSMDFANHRGFVKSLVVRQQDFLEGDTCLDELPSHISSHICGEALEAFNELFANDIWVKEPDLGLTLPAERMDDAELEIFETLTSVMEIIWSHFWTDTPKPGANVEYDLLRFVKGFGGVVSSERLDAFLELAVDHVLAATESGLIMS